MSSEEKREKSEPPQKLDLYVIARIIIVLKEKGSINRTNLATYSGLAYDKLARYLSWMYQKELVSSDAEGNMFLTEKGSQSYEELVDWIMRYVGKVRFPKI